MKRVSGQQHVARGHLVAPTLEWEGLPVLGGREAPAARRERRLSVLIAVAFWIVVGWFVLGWVF